MSHKPSGSRLSRDDLVGYAGGRFNLTSPYGGFGPLASPLVTPEPSSITLLGTGFLGIAGTLRRAVV